MNSDNISDSGAGVLGYNTFAYCGNNPVNGSDPTGHGVLEKIKSVFTLNLKTAKAYFKSLLNSINCNMGLGIGIGVKAKATTSQSLSVGGELSAKSIDSFGISEGNFQCDTQTSISANLEIASAINLGSEYGYRHSLLDDNCSCDRLTEPIAARCKCPASVKYSDNQTFVGFSAGVYFGLGGEVNCGIDVISLSIEWNKISDNYVSNLHEMRLFDD